MLSPCVMERSSNINIFRFTPLTCAFWCCSAALGPRSGSCTSWCLWRCCCFQAYAGPAAGGCGMPSLIKNLISHRVIREMLRGKLAQTGLNPGGRRSQTTQKVYSLARIRHLYRTALVCRDVLNNINRAVRFRPAVPGWLPLSGSSWHPASYKLHRLVYLYLQEQ